MLWERRFRVELFRHPDSHRPKDLVSFFLRAEGRGN